MRLKVQQVFPAAYPPKQDGSPLGPLCVIADHRAGLPLSAHSNPRPVLRYTDSLGAFLTVASTILASLAVALSTVDCSRTLLRIPTQPRKAGYAAHSSHHIQVPAHAATNRSSQQKWVSTRTGSTPACHCGSPHPLNPQHRPPTGRQQPSPGTSQVCPLRLFRSVFGSRHPH